MPDTPAVAGAIKSQFLCAPKGSISYSIFGVGEYLA